MREYDYDEYVLNKYRKKRKKHRVLRRLLLIIIVLILAIAVTAGLAVNKTLNKINRKSLGTGSLNEQEVDGYTNILLLGVDARDMSDLETNTRTDAIMIASINDDTKKIKLTSIYRDTYLKMGNTDTYDKITNAYSYGGLDETVTSVNQAMDLDIDKYVLVNFKAVADAVDDVNGITVNVQQYEISELNKYTVETAKIIGRKHYDLVTEPGRQKLDGCQAVSYGRIRKGVGDDYMRTSRMRIVVNAVLDKVKKMGIVELNDFLDDVLPEIQTNMSNAEMLGYLLNYKKLDITSGKGFPYNKESATVGGASVVVPTDLEGDVVKFHKKVFGETDFQISQTAADISDAIKLRTGLGGTTGYSSGYGTYGAYGSSGQTYGQTQ